MSAVGLLASVMRLNTRLFLNCLDGVTDERALERPGGTTNSLTFVACHLVDSRHFTAGLLGLELWNPFAELLAGVNSIDDVGDLPAVVAVRDAWKSISVELEACVAGLGRQEVSVQSPHRFPVDDPTLLGGLGFLIHHESYHIGQMALLRKYLGYAAMTYR